MTYPADNTRKKDTDFVRQIKKNFSVTMILGSVTKVKMYVITEIKQM